MRALDLFCCAGGASRGLAQAGFEVTGVDIEPQPEYPYRFIQASALDADLSGYDLIWASPPCQAHSRATKRWPGTEHPDLIPQTRERLKDSGALYIIENVVGAPLERPLTLCGSMFGLGVRRHRLFETNFPVHQPRCEHAKQGKVVGVYGHSGGSSKRDGLRFGGVEAWRRAMGIPDMTRDKLAQAIPPAYSLYLACLARIVLARS